MLNLTLLSKVLYGKFCRSFVFQINREYQTIKQYKGRMETIFTLGGEGVEMKLMFGGVNYRVVLVGYTGL